MISATYILCAVSVIWLITMIVTQRYVSDTLEREMNRAKEMHARHMAALTTEINRLRRVLSRFQGKTNDPS